MNSTSMKIKKFLSNRNTVALICAVLGLVVLLVGYRITVNSAIQPRTIPYAKVTIQPRTKITDDMIGYIQVPKAAIEGMGGDKLITDKKQIINYYSNVNTMIPAGSMFYSGAVVEKKVLPDYALRDQKEGETLAYLTVNMSSSYVNSIVPDGYIDLYVKAIDNGTARVGKFVENIKVTAVKDSKGQEVFEDSEEPRTPMYVLFSVPSETFIYLQKASIAGLTIFPVPTSVSWSDIEPEASSITSAELKLYIDERASEFVQDGSNIIESGEGGINSNPNENGENIDPTTTTP